MTPILIALTTLAGFPAARVCAARADAYSRTHHWPGVGLWLRTQVACMCIKLELPMPRRRVRTRLVSATGKHRVPR